MGAGFWFPFAPGSCMECRIAKFGVPAEFRSRPSEANGNGGGHPMN